MNSKEVAAFEKLVRDIKDVLHFIQMRTVRISEREQPYAEAWSKAMSAIDRFKIALEAEERGVEKAR